MFGDAAQREIFAKSVVELFDKTGIDGLDLDWEYPAIEGYPGHVYDTADRHHFTLLVQAIRKAMGKKYLLSFAAGGFIKYMEQSIDWPVVLKQVDFVNLMTYDLVGGYATITGHHTPLTGIRKNEESLTRCTEWLLQHHADPQKLIAGAAFYARVWEHVPDTNHGLYQPGVFKQGVSYRDFDKFFSDSSGYTYYWDDHAKAPYQYNAKEHLYATFDDKRSLKEKAKFIRQKKMGGIMFWELSLDKNTNGLVDAIYEDLH
jgi:chitinase